MWNEEGIQRVTAMWNDGKSASEIALALGCTRNAVIGKVHRLKLSQRSTQVWHRSRSSRWKIIWTTDMDATLRACLAEKRSAKQIATILEISAQSVSNRCRVLGLQLAPPGGWHGRGGGIPYSRNGKRPSVTTRPRPTPKAKPVGVAAPVNNPVTLIDRTPFQCCWPIGETRGPDTLMCGAPKEFEKPYCEWHQRIGRSEPSPERTEIRRTSARQFAA